MHQTLEQKTLAYWLISKRYNGRMSRGVSCEEVNRTCNSIYMQLNPERPLFNCLTKLQQEVIRGPERIDVSNSAAN